MSSNDIYINYLLDRTGSMADIWEATVEGFNGYKNEQAQEEGTAYLTLTAFDLPAGKDKPEIKVVFDAMDCKDIPDLKDQVFPRGMTPLLDAIGIAIENTEDWVVSHPDFEGKVLLVINTDGHENASREFSLEGVKAAIERKEKEGWEIAFLGAKIDAFDVAGSLGIDRGKTLSYASTPEGSRQASAMLSTSTIGTRGGETFAWDREKKKRRENSGTKSK